MLTTWHLLKSGAMVMNIADQGCQFTGNYGLYRVVLDCWFGIKTGNRWAFSELP
jgi:hypothetical protein